MKKCAKCQKTMTVREYYYHNKIESVPGYVCYTCFKGNIQDRQIAKGISREEFNQRLKGNYANETSSNLI